MRRDIPTLKSEYFDIVVIGGGINGCAIARDAALRGAKVALVEKDDFASGASGKTTKLIHGGIRYLEQANFKLVYEALRERATLLKTAQSRVHPLEFVILVYKNDPRSMLKMRAGVFLYDFLAGKNNIRCHRTLKKDEVTTLERNIEQKNLEGGIIYCDAQMDDIRLCLDNALSAYEAGSAIANKIEAVSFVKENGKVCGIEAEDKLTGERFRISAKVVINAAGAWSNILVKMDEPDSPPITRPTKGIHIVFRKLPHNRAVLLSAHKDKRIFFIIPWRGLSLIGTTDTDYVGSPDSVYADSGDIEYLLNEAARIFPNENIDRRGIITTYASLRPLVNTQGRLPWHVSREHIIKVSKSGLISVVGGKFTTYRHLAEEVVDLALSKLEGRSFKKCVTASVGPSFVSSEYEKKDLRSSIERAVKDEMAHTLIDLLFRRLQFATRDGLVLNSLEECSLIMAEILGWSDAKRKSEIEFYKKELEKNAAFDRKI